MTRSKSAATRVPEAEKAFLTGLLELLTDSPARCREAVQIVEPDAITIDWGRELLAAITAAVTLEAPSIADVLRIARERAIDPAADGVDPERQLAAELLEASAGNRGGYARGVARHAGEIMKAHARRQTIKAAEVAVAVAADPAAQAEEIEAAARGVAAASAAMPTERLKWEPLPVDLLPEPVGTFVAEAAETLQAEPAFVALPLLASITSVIGNRRRIELWPGWQEPAVLWLATVAESGSLKSPAGRKALRFIRERQAAAFADHRASLADWNVAKREHDATRRARSGEEEPLAEKPAAERFIVNDCTPESLAPILEKNPRGLLVDRDELSGWFDHDRYSGGRGGAEVAHWLSAYDAGPWVVDRRHSDTIYVPSAAISIVGTIQPKVLGRAVGSRHVDNGLLQRFILAAPPKRKREIPRGDVDFATAAALESMFATLFVLPTAADGQPTVLDLTREAAEVWNEFYLAHAEQQFAASGPVASMLAKAEGWAARLSLVCHSIRQAGAEPALANRVDADSIRRGVGLARWAAREWQRVFHGMADGAALEDDAALVRWLAARGGVATPRDVQRGLHRYRRPGAAEAGLQRLVQTGRAQWQASPTGGRPADAVRLK